MPTLTAQEIESQSLAAIDLAAGYPMWYSPSEDIDIESLASNVRATTSLHRAELDKHLSAAVLAFTGANTLSSVACRATFSGSVALQRALVALHAEAIQCGASDVKILVQTPSFDVLHLLAREVFGTAPIYLSVNDDLPANSTPLYHFLSAIRLHAKESKTTKYILALCSPNNPNGFVWAEVAMKAVVELCQKLDIRLLVDYCFLSAGVHLPWEISTIWKVAGRYTKWIAIWDTGKTFDLAGEKLGFLLTPSADLLLHVDNALQVLQFDQPARLKGLIVALLNSAKAQKMVLKLRTACIANYRQLQTLELKRARLLSLKAGSLALIDISATTKSATELRKSLLGEGLGVVDAQPFFGSLRPRAQLLRIALARPTDYFARALLILKTSLQ